MEQLTEEDKARLRRPVTPKDVKEIEATRPSEIVDAPLIEVPDALDMKDVHFLRPANLRDVSGGGQKIPRFFTINWGHFTVDRLGWVVARFQVPFVDKPTVLGTGGHRDGWFRNLVFGAIYADKEKIATKAGNDLKAAVGARIPWPFGFLAEIFFVVGWLFGYFSAWLWNAMSPYVTKQAEEALNRSIPLLFRYSGLPKMKMSLLSLRNITIETVEILGIPGVQTNWFAIGK